MRGFTSQHDRIKENRMLILNDSLQEGYNAITDMETCQPEMMMDIGIQVIGQGQTIGFYDSDKETALLLLSGSVAFSWEQENINADRSSLFDENPVVLHVPAGMAASVTALSNAEVLVQKTTNDRIFDAKFYAKEDCTSDIFGENVWHDTARRLVRTVFDFKNAPYSNMVIGEVINFPGKWSSYIPHGHDQPEVYFYRFDREHGFGAAFIGDQAFKIRHNSALCIQGGPTHPQASAPGYAMYYCWMIRHLKDNPWITRVDDERYKWLLEKDVKIWPDK